MQVSIVIPTRRWDDDLDRALHHLRAQELPPGVDLDVVVAVAEPVAEAPDDVTVVANPSGSIPEGLNRAIRASSGEVVARVDSRSVVGPDHVARVVATLADPEIGCVGGAALALDRGVFGSAYAMAFNSPLLGPSPYRYRRTSGPVDTAYLGAWRRDDLLAVGLFDERLQRNQDNDLAQRIRARGQVVWYDADLVVGYRSGRGLAASVAHHRAFGRWRTVQSEQGGRGFDRRHVGALVGLASAAVGGVALLTSKPGRRIAVGAGIAAYATAAATARHTATRLRATRPDIDGPDLHPTAPLAAPLLAVLIDGAWLAGVVEGLLARRARAPSRRREGPAEAVPSGAEP